MHRALLNVITNAIDAAAVTKRDRESEGQVTVQLSLDSNRQKVQIAVSDNGDGIAEDLQSKIFAPFHSTKGGRGTGLGLPVSQKILREHAGDITLRSTIDSGSTFTLFWPVGVDLAPQTLTGC
jgi:signal transduction histidine kinase